MTLRDFLKYYEDKNGYVHVTNKEFHPVFSDKTSAIAEGKYAAILECEVISFGIYYGSAIRIRIKY